MALLVFLSVPLYFRPSENIVGGRDPGAYFSTGIHISSTGSFKVNEPILRHLSERERRAFYYVRHRIHQIFPGFVVTDERSGSVTPYFYNLYSVWIAIFASIGGAKAGLYVNPLFALLSLIAIYRLGKNLFGEPAGFFAALFLLLSPAQGWFARWTASEPLAQFFLLSALSCLLLLFKNKEFPLSGIISAFLFACLFLTRLSSFLLLLPPLIVCFYFGSLFRINKRDLAFIFPFIILLFLVYFQLLHINYLPTKAVLLSLSSILRFHRIINVSHAKILLLGSLLIWLIAKFPGIKQPQVSRTLKSRIALTLGICICALFAWAYFIRPKTCTLLDASNLPDLGLFLSPLLLFLAFIGILLFLKRQKNLGEIAIIFILLIPTSAVLYRKLVHPWYMWAARRFITQAIPAACLLAAIPLGLLWKKGRSVGRAVAIVILILIAGRNVLRGKESFLVRDLEGAFSFTEALAARLPGKGVAIFEGNWFATPTHFLQNRNCLQVSDQTPERCQLILRAVRRLLRGGERVFFVTPGGPFYAGEVTLEKIARLPFRSKELQASKSLPEEIEQISEEYSIFELRSGVPPQEEGARPFLINIGSRCFGLEGAWGRDWPMAERSADQAYRWTDGSASLLLDGFPSIRLIGVALDMKAPLHFWKTERVVTLLADGSAVGRRRAERRFEEVAFAIPPRGRVRRVEILSDAHRPAGERRTLGVMVRRVRLIYEGGIEVALNMEEAAPFLERGFHGLEGTVRREGKGRLLKGAGGVTLPLLPRQGILELRVRMRSSAPQGKVRLSLGRDFSRQVELRGEFRIYAFRIPLKTLKLPPGIRPVLRFRPVEELLVDWVRGIPENSP